MKNKGFISITLIELMIIIAMLAILVAVIIPAVKGTRMCDDSNDKYCRSNVITTPDGLRIGCIKGVNYFLDQYLRPMTPVIDEDTKQPQLCEIERQ